VIWQDIQQIDKCSHQYWLNGQALALDLGVPLKDMEFVQFHPTTLYATNILMSEGARVKGGILINSRGERFMKRYAPNSMI